MAGLEEDQQFMNPGDDPNLVVPVEFGGLNKPIALRTRRARWRAFSCRTITRLRHVEAAFHEPVAGPLVIGDGRWLGARRNGAGTDAAIYA